jgi:hypothetical protein
MSLSPLAPVTDYQSMLNRIFWFTTAAALAATWMLRTSAPAIESGLSRLDFVLAMGDDKLLPISGGYLFPALAVALASRIFRLHSRLSDFLGIRECFDVDVILVEFARRLGLDLRGVSHEELRRARHPLMRKLFYPYVSGSHPVVDQQLIHQALDAWSWFWIGLEVTVVMVFAGMTLIAFGVYHAGAEILLAALALAAVGLPAVRSQCCRLAIAQVRAIVDDPARAAVARAAFAELTAEAPPRRMAA